MFGKRLKAFVTAVMLALTLLASAVLPAVMLASELSSYGSGGG